MPSSNSSNMPGSLLRELQIIWRLLQDDQVSPLLKIVPLLSLVYLVWPIDLIAAPALGLGQLDDILIIILGILTLRYLSPRTSISRAEETRPDIDQENEEEPQIVEGDFRALDE